MTHQFRIMLDSNRVTSDKNVPTGVISAELHGWAHNLPELSVSSLKLLVHKAQLVQGADQQFPFGSEPRKQAGSGRIVLTTSSTSNTVTNRQLSDSSPRPPVD